MEEDKRQLIVLAGLLHDIGKLLERGNLFPEARKDPECLSMCKTGSKGLTHFHAAHTRAFCDWLEPKFSCFDEMAEDWKIWCAAHHKEEENNSEASVIRLADRLSSSERESGNYYLSDIHRKTRLEPVLERVFLEGNPEENGLKTMHRYPVSPVTGRREDLFPQTAEKLGVSEMPGAAHAVMKEGEWTHLVASAPLTAEYEALGNEFLREVEALAEKSRHIALKDLTVCLMTLLERYTANIPSATNLRHPDISLFDHARTTAAIAQALYVQNEHDENWQTVIAPDDATARWLMVCGDFSGIQNFIFNLAHKGAAKGLRGRSFYVGHFCRMCADYMLRELRLSKAALLYNSGGKFYMLLPVCLKENLYEIRAKVNEWLLNRFDDSVFFGLGLAPVSANMFRLGQMDEAWKECAENLERDRLKKFRERMAVPSFFAPDPDSHPDRHCRVCGSRRQVSEDFGEEGAGCASCEEMERLGRHIADTEAILSCHGSPAEIHELADAIGVNQRRRFLMNDLNAGFLMLASDHLKQTDGLRLDGELCFLNELAEKNFSELPLPEAAITGMSLGKWNKNKRTAEGEPWGFDEYAENAEGIKRLGILRMDVDNLGSIFIRGLRFPVRDNDGRGDVQRVKDSDGARRISRRSMASISRMATLSRQLSHFFSGYLVKLMDAFDRCQIIYAGGDDLFIIGSWDQLPDLAERIRSEFQAFCCDNPAFTISGGMTLHRGKYPIYKGAQQAGEAEHAAKTLRSAWGMAPSGMEKDAFCFSNVAVVWEDFETAKEIKEMFEREKDDNRGLLRFLGGVVAGNKILVEKISRNTGCDVTEAWKRIAYESWRWRTAYQLRRRYGKDKDGMIPKWSALLFACEEDTEKIVPAYAWMEFPIRWFDYQRRGKENVDERK